IALRKENGRRRMRTEEPERTCQGGSSAQRRLPALDHADSKLTDEGLKALGELESVRSLDLSRTRITGSGLRDLARLKSRAATPLRKSSNESPRPDTHEFESYANWRAMSMES